jgi:hypothetical protein
MSGISQDFINDLGFLYEHIHVKDQDFLNEESEYYDEEASELVEDILSTISLSMIYEGFSANAVIGFLADSSEEEIVEKYLSFNESIISESVVSEEYIQEQLEILNEFVGALFRVGKALVKGAKYAKGAKGAAPFTRMASGFKSAGTAAERIAKQGPKASSIVRSTLSKGVQKVKDIAKGAKAALPGIAKGALLAGTGVLTGYAGAKLGNGGSGQQDGGKQTPSGTEGTGGSGSGGGTGGSAMRDPVRPSKTQDSRNTQYQKDRAAISTAKTPEAKKAAIKKAEETGMAAWAKAHPELAAKVKPGQSGYDVISKTRVKPGPNEKQDQTPTIGKPEAQIDKSSVEADIKREQERLKKKAQQTPVTAKESYDAYDVILEYLIDTEQVDTLEEAHYVMMEMDVETVGNIIEQYEDYLLAEEVEEWVNGLVEEGYDLSEYTWDDMVEYYVNEARVDAGKTDKEKREARRDRNDTSGLDFFHTISRGKKKVKGRKTSYDNEGKMIRKYKTMQDDKRAAQKDQENAEYNERQRVQSRGTWDKD